MSCCSQGGQLPAMSGRAFAESEGAPPHMPAECGSACSHFPPSPVAHIAYTSAQNVHNIACSRIGNLRSKGTQCIHTWCSKVSLQELAAQRVHVPKHALPPSGVAHLERPAFAARTRERLGCIDTGGTSNSAPALALAGTALDLQAASALKQRSVALSVAWVGAC